MKNEIYLNGVLIKKIDLRSLDDAKKLNIEYKKEQATHAIRSAGLDESTQQNAALGIYPPERCETIKSYISACRNEYLRCKGLIQAAQTNDEADAVQFVAPPVPEGI
jgi:hypothetical protein